MATDSPSFALPALVHLGELAGVQPTIVVDTREIKPLVFSRLPSVRTSLLTGDYSVAGLEELFAIERKTISDLVGCCCGENRERFERELHRLRGYRFKRLLIVGNPLDIQAGNYRSNVKPQAVLASLHAWEMRFDCPVVFRHTPGAAAAQIELWCYWFAREAVCSTNNLWRNSRGSGLKLPSAPTPTTGD